MENVAREQFPYPQPADFHKAWPKPACVSWEQHGSWRLLSRTVEVTPDSIQAQQAEFKPGTATSVLTELDLKTAERTGQAPKSQKKLKN